MILFLDSGAGGGGSPIDPHWSNVAALLHFDGADGSTSIIDATGRAWAVIGYPEIDTGESKFGGSSLLWPTSARGAVTTANSNDFRMDIDFTMEGWVRFAVGSGDSVFWQLSADIFQWTYRFCVIRQSSSLRVFFNYGADYDMSPAGSLPAGAWHHIAIVRSGSACLMFVNGTLVHTRSMAAWGGASLQPVLGYPPPEPTTAYQARGHMDEWRFTKGVARYTADFTPPAAPFPNS